MILRQLHIECDICKKSMHCTNGIGTHVEARRIAKLEGWHRVGKAEKTVNWRDRPVPIYKDICPDCITEWKK